MVTGEDNVSFVPEHTNSFINVDGPLLGVSDYMVIE